MPVTFGSVGDIISVSLLVKDLLVALDDSRGSSAEYQAVVRELYILDTALLQVEQLSRSRATTPELHALYETAKHTVTKCRDSVAEFTSRVKKYSGSLAVGGSGNVLKDTARKIQWRASQKDAEILKFRAEVTGYSDSINMLLATGMMKLLGTKNDDLKNQLAEDGQRMHVALDINTQALKEVQIRLDDNRRLVSAGNSLASRMMDRLEWIQKLGSELKRFMANIINGNIAIYREVVALRSAFSKHVDRPLLEDPFILEDAIGRIAPVHLRFVNSWAAFHAVMEIRFQGKQGFKKICRKEYVLQESAMGREVDMSLDFDDAFLPGQKINMSLVFKRDSTEQSTQATGHCPRCNTVSEQLADVDVLCSTCNMWFRRITEIHEVDLPHPAPRNTSVHFGKPSFGSVRFGLKPLKRNLEEADREDGDYSRFKRIRVVSEAKRVKAPKIFTGVKQKHTFNKPDEKYTDTTKILKINVAKGFVDIVPEVAGKNSHFHGLVEKDTFEFARSINNNADDRGHNLYKNQRRWEEAVQMMETRKKKLGDDHPDTLSSMANLALTYWEQGRLEEAEKLEVQVMETRKKKLGNDHPDTLSSMANLASTYRKQGLLEEAEKLQVQVMEACKKKLRDDHPDTLRSMANLASTFWKQGHLEEAEKLEVQVMETRKKKLGHGHPDTLRSMANLASTYREQGQLEEAEKLQVQVMDAYKKKLRDDHPDILRSMANLASTYRKQGQLEEAEKLEVQVMETRKKKLGDDHPDTLSSMANLASTYREQGRLEEARKLQVQVMEACKKKLRDDHPDTLRSMANLASTYRKQGRLEETEKLEVQVMETRKKKLRDDHPDTLSSMANLALTYREQGRLEEAEKLEVQVMETRKKKLGDDHHDTLSTRPT